MESLRTNALSIFKEFSIYSKGLCVVFLIFYFVSFWSKYNAIYFCIQPGKLFPPNLWVWTLITFSFSFSEHSIWSLCVNILTVFLAEKLLLPLWKWMELIKFCLIVNITSAVLAAFYFYISYVFTFRPSALFHHYIHGMTPILAALTVASRQQMGDNVLLALPLGNLRNKHLSFCLTCITLLLSVLEIIEITYLFLSINGILVSWIYLRFYQKHKTGGKGDQSDDFTFAGFFPNHLEPPVAIMSNTIFSVLIRLKICKKFDRRYDLNSPTTITLNMSGIDLQDSERRKQLALKALNERLNRPESTTQWPSMVDESKDNDTSNAASGNPTTPTELSTVSKENSDSASVQLESVAVSETDEKATTGEDRTS